jgi:hypothetical protein
VKLQEVKEMAKHRGLKVKKMIKNEIIRAIQRDEGNFPCYGTGKSAECGQSNCLWRKDCE